MEAIRNYVEAMFATLPQNADMTSMKHEMLENLEEKYQVLLSEGKNEFEAAGIVLAGIGTAAELRAELGLEEERSAPAPAEKVLPLPERKSAPMQDFLAPPEIAAEYRAFRAKFGLAIAISVALFLLAPVANIFFEELLHLSLLGNVALFVLVATGVAALIYWGLRDGFYKEVYGLGGARRAVKLAADDPLIAEYSVFLTGFSYAIGGAVALFILSPAMLMLGEEVLHISLLGIFFMFSMVAIGVGLCIVWGMRWVAIREQLGFSEHGYDHHGMPARQEGGRFTGLFAGIVFPLAAMFFLYRGLTVGNWHPGWIIFPVCGILTGAVAMIEEFVIGKR